MSKVALQAEDEQIIGRRVASGVLGTTGDSQMIAVDYWRK